MYVNFYDKMISNRNVRLEQYTLTHIICLFISCIYIFIDLAVFGTLHHTTTIVYILLLKDTCTCSGDDGSDF